MIQVLKICSLSGDSPVPGNSCSRFLSSLQSTKPAPEPFFVESRAYLYLGCHRATLILRLGNLNRVPLHPH